MSPEERIELQCEAAELRDRVLFYDARCQELEKELHESGVRLARAEDEISRLEHRLEEAGLPSAGAATDEEMSVIAMALEATREELGRERQRVDELTGLLQQSEQRYDGIVNELDAAYDALEQTHRRELENIQKDRDRVETLGRVLQEQLQEKESAIDELVNGLHEQAEKFESQVATLQEENAGLKERIESLAREAAGKLPEEAQKAVDREQAEHRRLREALDAKVRELQRNLELKGQELERLQASAQSRAGALQEREQETSAFRARLEEAERHLSETRTALADARAAAAEAAEIEPLRARLEEAHAEIKRLRASTVEASQIKALQSRAEAAVAELAALQADLKAARTARTKAEDDAEQFRIRAEEFRRRLVKLEEEGSASGPLARERDQHKARAVELEALNSDLEAKLAEAEKALSAQQAAAKEIRLKHETRLKETEEKLQAARAARSEADQDQAAGFEAERRELTGRIERVESDLRKAQIEADAAAAKVASVASSVRTAAAREAQLKNARAELQTLKDRIDAQQKRIEEHEAELAARAEQLREAEGQIQESRRARAALEEETEARLDEQRRQFEARLEEVRSAAAAEVQSDQVSALRVQIDFLRKKERESDELAWKAQALERDLADVRGRLKEAEDKASAHDKARAEMDQLMARQTETYEKQVASLQAELETVRERAGPASGGEGGGAALRERADRLIQERAELQAQIKTQAQVFTELKRRVENIQKVLQLKDERIQELERRLEEAKKEGRDAARATLRRIKTKLGIPVPEGPKAPSEEHESKLRKIQDEVAHGREAFEQKIRELQEAAAGGKPEWPEAPGKKDRFKQELKQIVDRRGHHIPIEGYSLQVMRSGLLAGLGRKSIARLLHGVSPDGLRVALTQPVVDGEKLRVALSVKQFNDTIDAEAQVNWVREVEFRAVWDADLVWTRIRDEDRRRIQKWLDFYSSIGRAPR